jgi:hypothetical protein
MEEQGAYTAPTIKARAEATRVYVEQDFMRFALILHFGQQKRADSDKVILLTEAVWQEVEPGMYHQDAGIPISREAAQDLMNQLWGMGIRPSGHPSGQTIKIFSGPKAITSKTCGRSSIRS